MSLNWISAAPILLVTILEGNVNAILNINMIHIFNGVRQGEILSPKVYSVYVDDLADYLVETQIERRINKQSIVC